MMAFNPFAAAQLPPGLAGTPIKAEDSTEALRFLAANSGLFGGAPMGLPPVDAVRAMLPGGLPFPLIYPSSLPPQEFKPELFSAGGGPMNPMLFEQFGFHPYGGLDGSRRKNATRETTAPLKKWLEQHMDHPYPGKGDKVRLAITANLTLTQVSTWFANARRRLKKENGGSMAIKRRPEDDDEDDMAELDRPSSSNSNESDKEDVDVDASETNENTKARDEMTPKKKILSIDDILDKTNGKKDEEVGSSKKDSPSSEESAPSMQFALQQQMLAMCRANPQLMAAMAPRPGFFPYHFMMNMAAMPQTPTGPPLNGSFTSETASVSPSSSHSPSAPAEESKSPLPTTEA